MRLSVIIAILNSHEIVRRHLLYFSRMNIPDDVEILYMDDGSDPPLKDTIGVEAVKIIPTNDHRPWTWAIARNAGARLAKGRYFMMTDIDYIITEECLLDARGFIGDRMGFKRQLGVLDENANLTQDLDVLMKYGLTWARANRKRVQLPPHSNNFVMHRDVFWDLGGYLENRVGRSYPQGEDRLFKKAWLRAVAQGKYMGHDYRPMLYMYPNGQFCGDADYNPFGLFHNLSRKVQDVD